MDIISNEACGYCDTSQDPNDICITCWKAMPGNSDTTHTKQCPKYWERGLDCRCIPVSIIQDILKGANPDDVM